MKKELVSILIVFLLLLVNTTAISEDAQTSRRDSDEEKVPLSPEFGKPLPIFKVRHRKNIHMAMRRALFPERRHHLGEEVFEKFQRYSLQTPKTFSSGKSDNSIKGNKPSKGKTIYVPDDCVTIQGATDNAKLGYHTLVRNDIYHAFDSSLNAWDDDVKEGNPWDGIGNTPYCIPGGENKERYPLMTLPVTQGFSINKVNTENQVDTHGVTNMVSSYSSGDTIVVPDDYPSIQEAVDHAIDGNTILVKAGVYYENVLVYKSVNIIGENKFTTFVDGMGSGHIFTVTADNVLISGFTIRNTDMGSAGIKIESNQVTIRDNIIKDCGDGIYLSFSQYSTIENNTLMDNNFGVYVDSSSTSKITNNKIELNNDGIAIWMSNRVTVENNWIKNNNYTGILLLWSNDDKIDGNIIEENGDIGIQMFSSCGNVIEWNNIKNNSHDGISLHKSGNNSIANNIIAGNFYGVSLRFYSSYSTITKNNIINNNDNGIRLDTSSGNTITKNNISNNGGNGIDLYYSSNNITNNSISKNEWDGIELCSSSNNNIFYLNSFVKNKGHNAWDEGKNYWDNGTIGNYWDDYRGRDTDGDGIGDKPYEIPPRWDTNVNLDHYPLVIDTQPPFVKIVTPEKNYRYFCISCKNKRMKRPIRYEGAIIWAINGFTVGAYAHDEETGIKKVEFYVDNEEEPRKMVRPPEEYEWCWNELLLFEEHTIKVKAYDLAGNVGVEELKVRVLNIPLP